MKRNDILRLWFDQLEAIYSKAGFHNLCNLNIFSECKNLDYCAVWELTMKQLWQTFKDSNEKLDRIFFDVQMIPAFVIFFIICEILHCLWWLTWRVGHAAETLLIRNSNLIKKPGVILGQYCVRLSDAALDDLFFKKTYFVESSLYICYEHRVCSNQRCLFTDFCKEKASFYISAGRCLQFLK